MRTVLRSPIVVGASMVIVVAAGIGILSLVGGGNSRSSIRAGAVSDTETPGFRFVEPVPADLASETFGDVQAWTGNELLAFGSDITKSRERSGGIAYSPETGSWRRLPDSGLGPMANTTGVWTGERLVIMGVQCPNNEADPEAEAPQCSPGTLAAASYRPDSDEWELIEAPPNEKAEYSPGSEGGGQQAVGSVNGVAYFVVSGRLWTLSPEQRIWQPAPEVPADTIEFCPGQDELIALRGDPVRRGTWSISTTEPGASAWSDFPDVSIGDSELSPGKIVCSPWGSLLISIDLQRGYFFDLGQKSWMEVSAAPEELTRRPPPPDAKVTNLPALSTYVWGAWTGSHFVFWQSAVPEDDQNVTWPGIAVALDNKSGTWQAASPGPPGDDKLQWIDGYALVFGDDGRTLGVAIYVPGV